MDWQSIVYCRVQKCENRHVKINGQLVCNTRSLPPKKGEYLVSDGLVVGIAEYEILFSNFDTTHRLVKNEDIKFWRALRKFNYEK